MADGQRVSQKRQRLDLRIDPDQKRQLERAAALQGESVTELVLRGALHEAEKAIRTYQILTLSAEDSRTFVKALLDPPPVSDRLLAAIEDYRATFGSQAR